jgi:hypothetical protein
MLNRQFYITMILLGIIFNIISSPSFLLNKELRAGFFIKKLCGRNYIDDILKLYFIVARIRHISIVHGYDLATKYDIGVLVIYQSRICIDIGQGFFS